MVLCMPCRYSSVRTIRLEDIMAGQGKKKKTLVQRPRSWKLRGAAMPSICREGMTHAVAGLGPGVILPCPGVAVLARTGGRTCPLCPCIITPTR